jgi:hypothetical protein
LKRTSNPAKLQPRFSPRTLPHSLLLRRFPSRGQIAGMHTLARNRYQRPTAHTMSEPRQARAWPGLGPGEHGGWREIPLHPSQEQPWRSWSRCQPTDPGPAHRLPEYRLGGDYELYRGVPFVVGSSLPTSDTRPWRSRNRGYVSVHVCVCVCVHVCVHVCIYNMNELCLRQSMHKESRTLGRQAIDLCGY